MGKVFDGIDANLKAWIDKQPMWFVATAPLDGDGYVRNIDGLPGMPSPDATGRVG